jgi:DNA-binding NarL/FixJ family response regulator
VEIPGGEVTSTVMRIKAVSPGTSILVLGVHDRAELVRDLLDLGVKGYLLKNATRLQLLAAIRSASSDDERVMLFVSRQSFTRPDEPDAQVLSARERDVLELVAAARSNAQIAAELSVTEATVKRHLRNIFVKLGAVSRIDAVNKGIAAAQISPPRPYYAARS